MSRHPVRLILWFVFITGVLRAEPLPVIPASSRILTTELVKNFWINTLSRKPIPSKPSGLHPEMQAAWQRALDDRRATIQSIESGCRETEARLAMHSHNAAAWRMQGNETAALAAEAELRILHEHLAKLQLLEMQRHAAHAQIDAAERLREIESRLSNLRTEFDRYHQNR
ncbi:MAG: hypothetical protein V4689_20995 [Verrucomicrobiota bacterium]